MSDVLCFSKVSFACLEILSITGLTIKETGIYGKGSRFEIFIPKGSYRFA